MCRDDGGDKTTSSSSSSGFMLRSNDIQSKSFDSDMKRRSATSTLHDHHDNEEQEYYSSNNVDEHEVSLDDLNDQRIVLFGIDISRFQENVQFCICTGGVFVFTIAYGYLQELISVHLFSRQYTLFLSTCQFAGYAFWSFVLMKLDKCSQHRMPLNFGNGNDKEHGDDWTWRGCCRNRLLAEHHGMYELVERHQYLSTSASGASASLSIASTGSMTSCSSFGKLPENDGEDYDHVHDQEKGNFTEITGPECMPKKVGPSWMLYISLSIIRAIDVGMTNGAMRFINYPMKTLVKSSRVAFTMIGGIIIGKKSYTRDEYIMVFMLVFGLCIFIHADMSTKDAVFHPIGLSMLVGA